MAGTNWADGIGKAISAIVGAFTILGILGGGVWWVADQSIRLRVLENEHAALKNLTEKIRISHDNLIVTVAQLSSCGAGTEKVSNKADIVDRRPGSPGKGVVANPDFSNPSDRDVASLKGDPTSVVVQVQQDGSVILRNGKHRRLKARKLSSGDLQIFSEREESP